MDGLEPDFEFATKFFAYGLLAMFGFGAASIWYGSPIVSVVVVAALAAPFVLLVASPVWRAGPAPGACRLCGYNLAGLAQALRCPECGGAIERDAKVTRP